MTSSNSLYRGRFAALRHPAYRRYWMGSFASVSATQLLMLGQGWLVFELSGSPLALGYLGAAIALPNILMTLFGGVLADLINRRQLLLATSACSSLLLIILTLLDITGLVTVWQVLLIAALFSMNTGVDWPTRQAIFPSLIERGDMVSAVSLNSIIWQTTRMLTPALGGLLIAFLDTWLVFALSALGFLAMLRVIQGLPLGWQAQQEGASEPSVTPLVRLREGLAFTLSHRTFTLLILLNYGIMYFGFSYMQMLPIFADLLGTAERGYGLMLSVSGIGSIIGTWLTGRWQETHRLGRVLFISATLTPFCLGMLALITALQASLPAPFILGLGAVLAASFTGSVFLIMSMTVLQLKVPDALRGRVMAIHSIAYSLMPLGGLVHGGFAAVSSAPIALACSASCLLLVMAIIPFRWPELLKLDGRREELAPETP